MSSESDDVLSLDEGAEEGSFSGFSSLSDSDKEPVASTAPKRKIRSAVKKAKEKGGKSKGKKQPPKKKTVTNKENVQSSSSAGVSSMHTSIDLTKLSETDITKLREVLGIKTVQAEQYANDSDIDAVFGHSLENLPNLHVEVDRNDISDNEMPHTEHTDIADNLTQALFEPEEGEIVDWELPRMRVPEKGKAISESLAKLINVACSSQCDTDSLVNKYKIPVNCELASPPLVNSEIWKVLDKRAQSQDRGLVDIQNLVATGMIPIIKLAEVLRPQLQGNAEARTLIADALTLMGQIQFNMSVKRRYLIRPNLKKKYFGLCNISTPVTTKLFGDDVSKDIKNCDSVSYLGKDQYGYKGVRGRGSRFPQRRGYFAYGDRANQGASSSSYGGYGHGGYGPQQHRFQPYPQRGQFRGMSRPRVTKKVPTATATAPNDQL